mmetsp:Transcript_441/g.888  ORF Transcript_441/g.888 Transcript_441/m.888 type:complete len:341 (-) Transcript_441:573-1595(-)
MPTSSRVVRWSVALFGLLSLSAIVGLVGFGHFKSLQLFGKQSNSDPASHMEGAIAENATVHEQIWRFLRLGEQAEAADILAGVEASSAQHSVVVFVSGNWYDARKVNEVVRLARMFPECTVLLTGGVGRLSDARSKELGGESLHMREMLVEAGVSPGRLRVYSGGRVTTHNAALLVHFVKETADGRPKGHRVSVLVVEESFLCRRVVATVQGMAQRDGEARAVMHRLVAVPTDTSWEGFTEVHRGSTGVAAFHVLGEMERLVQYSNPSNTPFLFTTDVALGTSGISEYQMKASGLPLSKLQSLAAHIKAQYSEDVARCHHVLRTGSQEDIQQELGPSQLT